MRSDKAEVIQKLFEINQMQMTGYKSTEICQYMADKYGFYRRKTEKYIKFVNDTRYKELSKTMEQQLKDSNDTYDFLKRKALKENDYRSAAMIQARKDKINGLEIQKIEHSGKIEVDKTNYDKLPNETDEAYEIRLKQIYEMKLKEASK
jgi:hypothetical protein